MDKKKNIKYYQKNFSYPILGHCGGTPVGLSMERKKRTEQENGVIQTYRITVFFTCPFSVFNFLCILEDVWFWINNRKRQAREINNDQENVQSQFPISGKT